MASTRRSVFEERSTGCQPVQSGRPRIREWSIGFRPARHDDPADAPRTGWKPLLRARRAFTLIEVIVASIILVILAGIISVRMTDTLHQRGSITVTRLEHLLDGIAHRQIVGQVQLALAYDARQREIWVERLAAPEGSMERPDDPAHWQRDLLIRPVELDGDVELVAVWFDGERFDGGFRRVFLPGEPRPLIEIEVAWGRHVETVTILPYEMRAIRRSQRDIGVRPKPEDLTAMGAGRERW